jgi:hypothetical protein
MENSPSLADVRNSVEAAVEAMPGEPDGPEELFHRFELICQEKLDARSSEFQDGVLREWLMSFLYQKQLELGLLPFGSAEPVDQ